MILDLDLYILSTYYAHILLVILVYYRYEGEGDFIFLKDALYKKPDISTLLFLTYFSTEDEDVSSLKPLVADLGKTDLCMATD